MKLKIINPSAVIDINKSKWGDIHELCHKCIKYVHVDFLFGQFDRLGIRKVHFE